MNKIELKAENIGKVFTGRKKIFKSVNFNLANSGSLGIIGRNGSGKSTLLKIIAGILKPNEGTISLFIDGIEIKKEEFYKYIGFVSPYLNIYEEFTPLEHFKIFASLRNFEFDEEKAKYLLKEFSLYNRRNDFIRTFSSGMKQRVKYILNLLPENHLLLLDEPFTNLDNIGIDSLKSIIEKFVTDGGSIIIATNDEREKALCNSFVSLGDSIKD